MEIRASRALSEDDIPVDFVAIPFTKIIAFIDCIGHFNLKFLEY